jgi:hypothetical protein
METITRVLDFLNTEFHGASLIHWALPVLLIMGILNMLILLALWNRVRDRIKKDTMCPVLQKQVTLKLDANVLRNPSKRSGLDVAACTEFLEGEVTCGKACLHNPDVQAVHAEEKRKHQEDMRQGNNIIP